MRNKILRDLRALHQLSRQANWSTEAMRRLAVASKLIPHREKVDEVVDEWRQFRVEELPFVWTNDLADKSDDHETNDDEMDDKQDCASENRIYDFWSKDFEKKILLGLPKFSILSLVVKFGMTFVQRNTDVEGAFRESKLV